MLSGLSQVYICTWVITVAHYIPKTILETRQSIFCFMEIVMRADAWSVLFNRDSHITYFFSLLSTVCGSFVQIIRFNNNNNNSKENTSTGKSLCFQVISQHTNCLYQTMPHPLGNRRMLLAVNSFSCGRWQIHPDLQIVDRRRTIACEQEFWFGISRLMRKTPNQRICWQGLNRKWRLHCHHLTRG